MNDLTDIENRLATDKDDFAHGYQDQSIRDREHLLELVRTLRAQIDAGKRAEAPSVRDVTTEIVYTIRKGRNMAAEHVPSNIWIDKKGNMTTTPKDAKMSKLNEYSQALAKALCDRAGLDPSGVKSEFDIERVTSKGTMVTLHVMMFMPPEEFAELEEAAKGATAA